MFVIIFEHCLIVRLVTMTKLNFVLDVCSLLFHFFYFYFPSMVQELLLYFGLILLSVIVVILFILFLWIVVWKLFLSRFKFIQALTDAKSEENINEFTEEKSTENAYRSRVRARRVCIIHLYHCLIFLM